MSLCDGVPNTIVRAQTYMKGMFTTHYQHQINLGMPGSPGGDSYIKLASYFSGVQVRGLVPLNVLGSH